MAPEGSLPCSQKSEHEPYSKANVHNLPPYLRLVLILSLIYVYISNVAYFLHVSQLKVSADFSSSVRVVNGPNTISSVISLP
jgi:hypothetical protein